IGNNLAAHSAASSVPWLARWFKRIKRVTSSADAGLFYYTHGRESWPNHLHSGQKLPHILASIQLILRTSVNNHPSAMCIKIASYQ
ncbi:hypothetical protein Lpp71_14939, partial [Lacticaseibacillus paracasei subsp. paracasei Lpp71]